MQGLILQKLFKFHGQFIYHRTHKTAVESAKVIGKRAFAHIQLPLDRLVNVEQADLRRVGLDLETTGRPPDRFQHVVFYKALQNFRNVIFRKTGHFCYLYRVDPVFRPCDQDHAVNRNGRGLG